MIFKDAILVHRLHDPVKDVGCSTLTVFVTSKNILRIYKSPRHNYFFIISLNAKGIVSLNVNNYIILSNAFIVEVVHFTKEHEL